MRLTKDAIERAVNEHARFINATARRDGSVPWEAWKILDGSLLLAKVDRYHDRVEFRYTHLGVQRMNKLAEDALRADPPPPMKLGPRPPLEHCASGFDGDCTHPQCPQNRDGEPLRSGRHCPLDNLPLDDQR